MPIQPSAAGSTQSTDRTGHSAAGSGAFPNDEFYGGPDFNEPGQSEHYIYVTYPPELKRRLLERYGRDIYLMLLRKDMYD